VVVAAWPAWTVTAAAVVTAAIVVAVMAVMPVVAITGVDVARSSHARLGDAVHHVLTVVPPPVVEAGDAAADAEHGACGKDEREKDSHGGFLVS